MGDSIRLQIADALKDRLDAGSVTVNSVVRSRPAGLNVYRHRLRPVETGDLPAQVIFFQAESAPNRLAVGALDWDLRVAVQSLAAVPDSDTPFDDTVDPLVNWATLAVFSDETFGGLSSLTEHEGTAWEADEHDDRLVRATTVFRIRYRTNEYDPEATT